MNDLDKETLNEDNEFLKSLEEIDEVEKNKDNEVDEEKLKEEQEEKNRNAEEARKRRELEAKQKQEEEEQKKVEEEKPKEEVVSPQKQVKDLTTKYPELDLANLDSDQNFQEYLKGKWVKGGDSITTIYEKYLDFEARVTKNSKEEVEKKFKKPSTPSLKGGSGGNGSNGGTNDVYSIQEMNELTRKMPNMNPQQYKKVEEKYNRSYAYHKNKR